jgi:hypothetical protein
VWVVVKGGLYMRKGRWLSKRDYERDKEEREYREKGRERRRDTGEDKGKVLGREGSGIEEGISYLYRILHSSVS